MEHAISPDIEPVKGLTFAMQVADYAAALKHCKSKAFETCIKRVARQSSFP
jgi:hypothetical protein